MNKRVVLILVGIVVAVVGFLIFTKPAEEASGTPSEHKVGAGTSGVVLMEYGDFQCPACGQYFPILQQVKEIYGDQITFQFRHFPLESIHKNARAASRAAEAASMQGKFWEMHDELFANQAQWQDTNDPVAIFESYAEAIGIDDLAKFTEDYKSSAVSSVINADLQAGRDAGASSTPTFMLDGKKLDPNPGASVAAFTELIDAAIKEKTGKDPQKPTETTAPEETVTDTPEATQPEVSQ